MSNPPPKYEPPSTDPYHNLSYTYGAWNASDCSANDLAFVENSAWQVAQPRGRASGHRGPPNNGGGGGGGSGTTSPHPSSAGLKPTTDGPRSAGPPAAASPNNIWTQKRSTSSNGAAPVAVNASAAATRPTDTASLAVAAAAPAPAAVGGGAGDDTGFNAAEVKAFLAREPAPAPYQMPETAGVGGARGSGGSPWGTKANHMANGQNFFTHLAKQVASLEEGG